MSELLKNAQNKRLEFKRIATGLVLEEITQTVLSGMNYHSVVRSFAVPSIIEEFIGFEIIVIPTDDVEWDNIQVIIPEVADEENS